MTGETLFEAIGLIDDAYIAEADKEKHIPRTVWVRWAVAACFVIALGASLPFVLRGGLKCATFASDSAAPETSMDTGEGGGYGIVGDVQENDQREQEKQNVVTHDIRADMTMMYPDYTSLASDAEMIVVGSVTAIESACNDRGWVDSTVSLDVGEVLKGKAAETMDVLMVGGSVTQVEYLEAVREKAVGKNGQAAYDEAMRSAKESNEILNMTFMGVENVRIGDRVLLFLTWSETDNAYRITGSSFYGQFFVEEQTQAVYKLIDGERQMAATLDEVRETVKNAPDNSAALKAARAQAPTVEKDYTVEPRDPYYDQFKQ